jgi:hypothetical protein
VRATFSAQVHINFGVHTDPCKMGTGLLPGVKRPERGIGHPSPSSAEVKERVELYFYSRYGPSWPVLGRTSFFNIIGESMYTSLPSHY